jgi:hypothetical protein
MNEKMKDFFMKTPTGVVTDALDYIGDKRVDGRGFPLRPEGKLFGRAFTIRPRRSFPRDRKIISISIWRPNSRRGILSLSTGWAPTIA